MPNLRYPFLLPSSFRTSHLLCLIVLFSAASAVFSIFGGVLKALFDSVINPLIALLIGKPDFSALRFELAGTVFPIGNLITAVVIFVFSSAVIYFAVLLPTIAVMTRLNRSDASPEPVKKCPECLSESPLTRVNARTVLPRSLKRIESGV